jgi:hypothetical protein
MQWPDPVIVDRQLVLSKQELETMNPWIYKMVAWHRRLAVAVEGVKQAPSRDLGRVYWDQRTRTWALVRQQSYVSVETRGRRSELRSRPKW